MRADREHNNIIFEHYLTARKHENNAKDFHAQALSIQLKAGKYPDGPGATNSQASIPNDIKKNQRVNTSLTAQRRNGGECSVPLDGMDVPKESIRLPGTP